MGIKVTVWQCMQPLRCCFTFEFISAWLIRNHCHANQHYTKSLHYSDIITTVMASQITGVSIVHSFGQANITENIKALRHWPLWGESTIDRLILHSKENVSIWWRHHGIIKHILRLMNAIKTGLYFQNMMVRIIFSSLALIDKYVPTLIWGKYLAHQNIMNAFDTCKVSIHQDSWKFKY